jgi:hypothetical protein
VLRRGSVRQCQCCASQKLYSVREQRKMQEGTPWVAWS